MLKAIAIISVAAIGFSNLPKAEAALVHTRGDFIKAIVGAPRVVDARAKMNAACHVVAETPNEVTMKDINCHNAIEALQRAAWLVTVDYFNAITKPEPARMSRDSLILSQLMEESNGHGGWWWLTND